MVEVDPIDSPVEADRPSSGERDLERRAIDVLPAPERPLERARKEMFGGNAYGDMVVRLRLRQAFGRLIRSAGDKGCFVILDPRLATRFTTAAPAPVRESW